MLEYSAVKTFAFPFSLPIIDYGLEMTTLKHANAMQISVQLLTIGLHCNFSVQEGPDKPWTSRDWIENEVGAELQSPWIAFFCAKIAVKKIRGISGEQPPCCATHLT
jgi:hypothetical protein